MALYSLTSKNEFARLNRLPSSDQTQVYNAIGRTAGAEASQGSNDNFFVKRGKSIENAVGTTGAAIASFVKDRAENDSTDNLRRTNKNNMNDIAKKYGYNTWGDWQDAYYAAKEAGDTAKVAEMEPQLKEFQAQANSNASATKEKADAYKDYRENNYVSQKINQDRGKFAGSAINTLSTAADITGLTTNPLANAIQGGVEGLADELEQNGLQDFSWERAGQNALVGATTGAVVGGLNKGITGAMAKRAAAKGLANTAVKSGLGNTIKQGVKTVAGGAARGALSGAVGGATGAGLQSALNGVEFGQGVQNALQGAVQGAKQGAITGATMAGANMAISKTPGVGKFYNELQSARQNWDQSGSNFNERLTNTLNSGDSAVGNWLNNRTQSKLLGTAGNLGDTIRDYTDQGYGPRKAEAKAYEDLIKEYYDERGVEGALEDAQAAGLPSDSNFRKAQRLVEGGSLGITPEDAFNDLKAIYGDDFKESTYLNKDGSWKYKDGEPYVWTTYKNKIAMNLASKLDAMDADTYSPGSDREGYVPGLDESYLETARRGQTNATTVSDDVKARLNYLRNEIDNERISYGEIAELENYKPEILALGDTQLAEWAGIPEEDFQAYQAQTPTTAKGWLKKAGQRVVEDINNSNLGNRVKDVAGEQYSDDIKNMYVNRNDMLGYTDDGTEPISVEEALGGKMRTQSVAQAPTQTAPAQLSNWDRLAQESGYASYDDVINGFMAANPNAKVTAGSVLTWMDNNPGDWNPNSPTTASGWAKRAGQRIVEDANKSNLGMRVQDVTEEAQAKNPQTEVYDMLNKKSTTEGKLRNAAGLKLQDQYGTIDKPTAKATNAPETLQKIASAGFTKPADVERMADVITGSNGEVSKLVANLVETADPVNTYTGETDSQSLDDFIDLSIQKRGLDGINEGKAVKSQINALMRSLPSHAEGSITFEDNPTDVFKLTQLLDSEAANYEGRSGMNYGTTNPDKLRAAQVIKDVSSLMKDRIYSTVDVNKALTPDVADNLKSYAPNNKAWADYVDNDIMSAQSVKDLRSVQAPWVRAKKIIDNGYMNSVTFGGRNGGSGSPIPLTKRGLAGAILGATVNSKPGLRAQAKILNKAADFVGSKTPSDSTTTVTNASVASPAELANMVDNYNPSAQLYNAIGRTEGLTNAEQERTAKYIIDAAQEAEVVPTMNTPEYTQLPAIAGTQTSGSTQVYDTISGTGANNTATYGSPYSSMEEERAVYFFPPTGNYWADMLSQAMRNAKNAEDYDALGSLYEMYQDAISQTTSQSSGKDYTNPSNWNSTDRSKLLSAQNSLNQIDQLESAYNTATGGQGSNAVQGWLRSRAADISGGNWDPSASNYNSLAQSVGMGIVKNLINLGVTEADAQRYLQYLPALTDTKEQAEQKLATLRSIYQNQINNLYSAYGV